MLWRAQTWSILKPSPKRSRPCGTDVAQMWHDSPRQQNRKTLYHKNAGRGVCVLVRRQGVEPWTLRLKGMRYGNMGKYCHIPKRGTARPRPEKPQIKDTLKRLSHTNAYVELLYFPLVVMWHRCGTHVARDRRRQWHASTARVL